MQLARSARLEQGWRDSGFPRLGIIATGKQWEECFLSQKLKLGRDMPEPVTMTMCMPSGSHNIIYLFVD